MDMATGTAIDITRRLSAGGFTDVSVVVVVIVASSSDVVAAQSSEL